MEPIVLRALVSMGLLGAGLAAGLAFASKKFAIEVDPRMEAIEGALPGANCGACGFPGCGNFAEAVVNGQAPMNGCVVGGAGVSQAVAKIMGTDSVNAPVAMKALVRCGGSCQKAKSRGDYVGIEDCKAAVLLGGGPKECSFGCIGLGTCERVCPFGAITMSEDGLPVVNWKRCTGCGVCAKNCPKGLFIMVPETSEVHVRCFSTDKGAQVRKACSVGCIGCKRCEKACEHSAITVTDFLAAIDYEKCTNCGKCAEVCPTGSITIIKEKRREPVKIDDGAKEVV